MDVIIVKNESGNIGLAVIKESRKLKSITYDAQDRSLIVFFENGETELVTTTIDARFHKNLLQNKEIFIAHFRSNKFDEDPSSEYKVRLEL